jgi:hypothetical protein
MAPPRPSREPLLFPELRRAPEAASPLARELQAARPFGKRTRYRTTVAGAGAGRRIVDTFVNEFWTSGQRQAHGLHEISYRACFKPQLPAFFIERLTRPGDVVYDPFMGRGTTLLEAALRGRVPAGNDVNPLSTLLLQPRLQPPLGPEVEQRLQQLDLRWNDALPDDLLVFYHPETLRELCALRAHLLARGQQGTFDPVDGWIRMVAVNRLSGHSPGFFSVYTLPPNQAVSADSQRRINARRRQTPPRRDVRALIARKSRSLLADLTAPQRERLCELRARARLLTGPADCTPAIVDQSVQLVVTSPPFLDVVQYKDDNWLRCWFCGIDPASVSITMARSLASWQQAMTAVLTELRRVLVRDGRVAFEVGEVRKGTLRLEEAVLPCAIAAGLEPELVLINEQKFTKTANCWGIANNERGTNSNRIVLLRQVG